VPEWQFSEHHTTRGRASCAEVEAAVRAVTAGEIRFLRTLTRIRQPRQLAAPRADIFERRPYLIPPVGVVVYAAGVLISLSAAVSLGLLES
jgi:hypothetical protein